MKRGDFLGKGILFNQGVGSISDSLKKFNDERVLLEYRRFCELLSEEEQDFLFKILLDKMKQTHSSAKLIDFFNNIMSKNEYLIPISIFSGNLSPYESIVFFLVENKQIKLKDIALLLGKSESSVWTTLRNAKRKNVLLNLNSSILYPLDNFDKKNSVLENIVVFLIEHQGLKVKEVSTILDKSVSTIWTTYNRVRQR